MHIYTVCAIVPWDAKECCLKYVGSYTQLFLVSSSGSDHCDPALASAPTCVSGSLSLLTNITAGAGSWQLHFDWALSAFWVQSRRIPAQCFLVLYHYSLFLNINQMVFHVCLWTQSWVYKFKVECLQRRQKWGFQLQHLEGAVPQVFREYQSYTNSFTTMVDSS